MSNVSAFDKLRIKADFARAKQDSVRKATAEEAAQILAAQQAAEEERLATAEVSDEGQLSYGAQPKIPGIQEGPNPLNVFGKGLLLQTEADIQRAAGQKELYGKGGQYIKEKVGPLAGKMMGGDYQRSVVANTIGFPVDAANALLSLLGIEVSSKPFMGSRQIKESLDYLSDKPHSERYIR